MMTKLLFALLFTTAVWGAAVDPAKGLTLENRFVRLEFEPGGMGLSAMIDRAGGFNHIGPVEGKHLLWEVNFGRGTQVRPMNNNYKLCTYARVDRMADGTQRAVMEWNDLRWWLENGAVTVKVIVELPPDSGIARWRIFVENLSDYWGVWTVSYPLVNGFPAAGSYDIARPVFASGGHLLKAWKEKVEGRYPSGNWPMQFMALSAGKNSVYLGTQDPEARAKDFLVEPGVRAATVHYAENMGVAGSDWPDYHPIEFGVYQGNWIGAAHHYRGWALKQKWAQAGPLSRRADMPQLVKDIGAWVQEGWEWNGAKGTPGEMNAPFVEAQRMMGTPMGLHWYGWHHMPFDNDYPHFLPAKPGFKERVKDLVSRGLLVMPYINGSSADMNIKDFDRFAPHAIMDEAGGLRMTKYSEQAGRLLSMCPSSVFWQDAISTLVDKLIGEEGVNGVYVDQISAMKHELCFNPKHAHPLGGGHYWATGNRELLRKIKNVAGKNGRNAVITSEGADEVFFDLLDANLTWALPTDWEIPMMEMVYSGYTIFIGSPCDFNQNARLFRFAQGQALIDGRQNGWMNFSLFKPEHAEKAAYLRQCARYRVAAKKYLTYGRLVEPIESSTAVPQFSDDQFGWNTKHRGTAPLAEGRLWQAEDGKLGVLLANYSDQEIPFTWRVDPGRYGMKGGAYKLADLTPEGTRALDTVTGAIERTEKLGARQLRVVEIAPR
jgi:hypothetical protein